MDIAERQLRPSEGLYDDARDPEGAT